MNTRIVTMVVGVLVATGLAACGGPEGGCYFGRTCSFGSSYYGNTGRDLCAANDGVWENPCPAEGCVGACEASSRRYTVWYYSSDYTVSEAQEDCDHDGGYWSDDCNWVLPENAP